MSTGSYNFYRHIPILQATRRKYIMRLIWVVVCLLAAPQVEQEN